MIAPCLNRACPHPDAAHDIYEPGDPYPTCCAEECSCGKPGDAQLRQLDDGTIVVERADPVIRVSSDLIRAMEAGNTAGPGFTAWDVERNILTLDTAGTYRYRHLRGDPNMPGVEIFGRMKS